jgi:hypothetical protein
LLFYRATLDGWLDRKPGKDTMHIKEIVPALDGPGVSYLPHDGRIVPLELLEYSIGQATGQATPRLGLTLSGAGLAKTK